MLTVNLTPEQAGILYELTQKEFDHLVTSYCERTEEYKKNVDNTYDAMCALRTVREADFYDRAIDDGGENPFLITKREYLLDRYVTVEQMAQQGIR